MVTNLRMIFWMGDLNYRFDDLDPDQVKKLTDDLEYEKLYSSDQVSKFNQYL